MSFLSAQYHLFLLDAWRIQAQLLSILRNWLQDLSSCILGRDFLIWPPSPSRPEVNTIWLSRVLGVNVTSVATGELDENRGFVGGVKVLMVETSQGLTSLVKKDQPAKYQSKTGRFGKYTRSALLQQQVCYRTL